MIRARMSAVTGLVWAALLASVPPLPAAAQEDAETATPDVPSGTALIRGRVVHLTRPEAAADVEVVVYALPPDAPPGLRRGRTDAEGHFTFEDVSNEPTTAYLVGARVGGIAYPGERVIFEPGQRERTVTVRITDATEDTSHLEVAEHRVRFDWIGDQLAVSERVELHNRSNLTVFVPAERRPTAGAGFVSELPEGHQGFGTPLGLPPEGLVREGTTLRYYGPFYPGGQQLAYGYTLPAPPGPIAWVATLRRPTGRLVLLVPQNGPDLRPADGAESETVEEEGRTYRAFEWEIARAPKTIRLAGEVPLAQHDPDAVQVAETRIFLEFDDALLLAREEHRLEVKGSSRVVGEAGAPLLRIPLPEDASEIRFATRSSEFGLRPDGQGGLAVHGPLPPGEAVVEILYRLPSSPDGVLLEREFAQKSSLLSVYVADTGLLTTSPRLHRRRPVRTPDRTHIHLEAFAIEAGETVPLRLVPLAARTGLASRGSAFFVLAGALVAGVFVLLPFWRPRGGATIALATDAAREARESVYQAIRDLDHDHETGKVEEGDYAQMRAELQLRAAALMKGSESPALAPAPAPAPAPENRCPSCDAEFRPGDRFCSQCGGSLVADPAERGAG